MSNVYSRQDIDVKKKEVKNAFFEFSAWSYVYPRIYFYNVYISIIFINVYGS